MMREQTLGEIEGCPYNANSCPKVRDLEKRVRNLERSQITVLRLCYFIAGVVSVTLGVNVL